MAVQQVELHPLAEYGQKFGFLDLGELQGDKSVAILLNADKNFRIFLVYNYPDAPQIYLLTPCEWAIG